MNPGHLLKGWKAKRKSKVMLIFARASSASELQGAERCFISAILHSCWTNGLCHAKTNPQLPQRTNCRWYKSSNPKSPHCHSWAGTAALDGLLKLFAFLKCINICKALLVAKCFGPDPWVQLCLPVCLVLPSCQDKPKWFKRWGTDACDPTGALGTSVQRPAQKTNEMSDPNLTNPKESSSLPTSLL